MALSAMANKGCFVNLLWGAGIQIALWFYAMVCLLPSVSHWRQPSINKDLLT
jgi:hypothetical protein